MQQANVNTSASTTVPTTTDATVQPTPAPPSTEFVTAAGEDRETVASVGSSNQSRFNSPLKVHPSRRPRGNRNQATSNRRTAQKDDKPRGQVFGAPALESGRNYPSKRGGPRGNRYWKPRFPSKSPSHTTQQPNGSAKASAETIVAERREPAGSETRDKRFSEACGSPLTKRIDEKPVSQNKPERARDRCERMHDRRVLTAPPGFVRKNKQIRPPPGFS